MIVGLKVAELAQSSGASGFGAEDWGLPLPGEEAVLVAELPKVPGASGFGGRKTGVFRYRGRRLCE